MASHPQRGPLFLPPALSLVLGYCSKTSNSPCYPSYIGHVLATWPFWGFLIHSLLSSTDWSIKSRLRHSKAWRWSHYWDAGGFRRGLGRHMQTGRCQHYGHEFFCYLRENNFLEAACSKFLQSPGSSQTVSIMGKTFACLLKNWLLTGSISQRAVRPSSDNCGLCYAVEGSVLISTGKLQNPPKLVEIFLLREAGLSP